MENLALEIEKKYQKDRRKLLQEYEEAQGECFAKYEGPDSRDARSFLDEMRELRIKLERNLEALVITKSRDLEALKNWPDQPQL